MKFKSTGTTYVDSSNPSENFSYSKKIISGNIQKGSCQNTTYKSLVIFDISRLQPYQIENAYLCLYIDNITSNGSYYSNDTLSIYKNTSNFNIQSVTWDSLPLSSSQISLSINSSDIFRYMKIDIIDYVNYWIDTGNNYGITLEGNNFYSSLVTFDSLNSSNPPWLFIEYKTLR